MSTTSTTKVLDPNYRPVKLAKRQLSEEEIEYRALGMTFVNSYHTLDPDQLARISARLAVLREYISARSTFFGA